MLPGDASRHAIHQSWTARVVVGTKTTTALARLVSMQRGDNDEEKEGSKRSGSNSHLRGGIVHLPDSRQEEW